MTAHRNQKAAVRAFAAAHACSYTEARRLLGLTEVHWTHTDAESGVRLEATLRGNEIDLRWIYPDGSTSNRAIRTHVLLGVDVWPQPRLQLTAAGALRPAWDDDRALPPALTSTLRDWVRSQVQRPELLSQDEERFVRQARQPVDCVISVVDKRQLTAVVHVYRGPTLEAPDGAAPAVLAANSARAEALSAAAGGHLQAAYGTQDLTERERFHVLDGFGAAGTQLELALELRRFVVEKDLPHDWIKPVNPAELTWTVVEHTEF